jgi:hypothetical protein
MSPMLTLPQQQVLCAHFIGCKHKPRLLGVSGLPITNGAWVCLDMASHPRTLLGKAVTRSQGSRLHGTAPCSDETRSPANHCCRQITWSSKCNHGKYSHEGSTHRQQVGAIRALTKGLHKKSVHWASCGVALASSVHTPPMQLPVATKTPLQWRRSRRHWGVPTGWGEGLLAPRSGHTGAKKGGGGKQRGGGGATEAIKPEQNKDKVKHPTPIHTFEKLSAVPAAQAATASSCSSSHRMSIRAVPRGSTNTPSEGALPLHHHHAPTTTGQRPCTLTPKQSSTVGYQHNDMDHKGVHEQDRDTKRAALPRPHLSLDMRPEAMEAAVSASAVDKYTEGCTGSKRAALDKSPAPATTPSLDASTGTGTPRPLACPARTLTQQLKSTCQQSEISRKGGRAVVL